MASLSFPFFSALSTMNDFLSGSGSPSIGYIAFLLFFFIKLWTVVDPPLFLGREFTSSFLFLFALATVPLFQYKNPWSPSFPPDPPTVFHFIQTLASGVAVILRLTGLERTSSMRDVALPLPLWVCFLCISAAISSFLTSPL